MAKQKQVGQPPLSRKQRFTAKEPHEQSAELSQAYREVFGGLAGRMVLQDFYSLALEGSLYVAQDPQQTVFKAGRISMLQQILFYLGLDNSQGLDELAGGEWDPLNLDKIET